MFSQETIKRHKESKIQALRTAALFMEIENQYEEQRKQEELERNCVEGIATFGTLAIVVAVLVCLVLICKASLS